MNKLAKPDFCGIFPPVTTPFSESGEIDLKALTANIGKYLNTGIAGFLVAGSTGEAAHLEIEERLAVIDCVLESAEYRPVMAGLSFSTLRQATGFLSKLEGRNLAALLVSVPSYYKNRMNDASLGEFFRNLADASPFPLLLYNFPRFTGIELSVDLIRSLAELSTIVGMKDSSGDLIYMQKVLEQTTDQQFEILSGNAETYGLARILGVRGAILAVGCAVPELAAQLHATDISTKEEYRKILVNIHRLSSVIVGKMGVPGVKYAMDMRGFDGAFCRPPLLPLNQNEKNEVEQVINQVFNDE